QGAAQHTLLARQSILRRAHRYWGDAGGKRVLTSRACKVDNHLLDQRVPLCGVAQIQAYQEVEPDILDVWYDPRAGIVASQIFSPVGGLYRHVGCLTQP